MSYNHGQTLSSINLPRSLGVVKFIAGVKSIVCGSEKVKIHTLEKY